MKQQEIIFDYGSFLGTNASKKWTFVDALVSFAPIFGTVWKSTIEAESAPENKLWEKAQNIMSLRHSDEKNITKLCRLAKKQGIAHFRLQMPYSLDNEQIEFIESHCDAVVKPEQNDEFSILL
ncbi:transporter [Vibrio maerlii]|uniref:transporter n=1 Tax=Vibrio maerlii TaxID=2231648 RepID=UPI000E3D22D4|nr:transporter [Vibrio maerlii]